MALRTGTLRRIPRGYDLFALACMADELPVVSPDDSEDTFLMLGMLQPRISLCDAELCRRSVTERIGAAVSRDEEENMEQNAITSSTCASDTGMLPLSKLDWLTVEG